MVKSPRIRFFHWKAAEAKSGVERLRAAGYSVSYKTPGPGFMAEIRKESPAAVVIDLSRLPSQGRDLGMAVRESKSTRHLPLVFVGGDPEKLERIKRQLPDAVYTPWSRIKSSLNRAIAHPPADPMVPASTLAGYSGTPLPKKLGIKAGSVVILANAPKDFEKTLGALPEGVSLRRQARGRCDLAIWFPKSAKDLSARVKRMGELADKDGLWIAWPKQASGIPTDLTQTVVRKMGLASGLVDYKVCAIDETWSGLKFAQRKSK